ncbi:bacteriocin [Dongia sp.]|uniref:bacteriocin n=1 Tax=Dongia sp. TaxID=1977262 RepID=UPI00375290B5
MSSQKTDPKSPQRPRKEELSAEELEKISGGLMKNTGIGKTTKSADPCEGGE